MAGLTEYSVTADISDREHHVVIVYPVSRIKKYTTIRLPYPTAGEIQYGIRSRGGIRR